MKTYLHQGAAELPAADFRAGQGASRMSGGSGGKLRLPAQGLQPFQVVPNFMFSAEAVVIIRSQITEWNALLQNMVDSDEHGVGHGHGSPGSFRVSLRCAGTGPQNKSPSLCWPPWRTAPAWTSASYSPCVSCRDTASRHSGCCLSKLPPRSTDAPRRGTRLMSMPVSARITSALRRAIPGIWQTSAMADWNSAMYASAIRSSS